jgi:hypothetical protein
METLRSNREPKTTSALTALRGHLQELLSLSRTNIKPTDRLEDLIPLRDRRQVWQDLQAAGFNLPGLGLSKRVLLVALALVVGPVLLLALALRTASVVLSMIELGVLSYRLTRPLAVHPPVYCETVPEAALYSTPFKMTDYKAGLWPPEEIAAKVRLIIAQAAGVRFQDASDDSCIACGLPNRTKEPS